MKYCGASPGTKWKSHLFKEGVGRILYGVAAVVVVVEVIGSEHESVVTGDHALGNNPLAVALFPLVDVTAAGSTTKLASPALFLYLQAAYI